MFYFLGFVLAAYLKLPLIALAVIGVIIAISIGMNDYKLNQLAAQRVAASPVGGSDEYLDEEEGGIFLMSNLTKSIPADERKMLKAF